MRMKLLVLAMFFSSVITPQVSLAADLMDGFYNTIHKAFQGKDCSSAPRSQECDHSSVSVGNYQDLKDLSEKVFYDRLSELEIKRLQCSQEQWQSMSNASTEGKVIQKLKLEQMNSTLEDLQLIKDQLERVAKESVRGDSLFTLKNMRKYARTAEEKSALDRKIMMARKADDARHDEIELLLSLYDQRISEIPNSDNPLVRDFIEGRLSLSGQSPKKVTSTEFQSLVTNVTKGFQQNIRDIKSTRHMGSYNLSIEDQARLSSDPTLIGQITKENPVLLAHIETYQCLAKSRLKTKENIELGATAVTTIASFGVGGAALASAKAARATFVLRSPATASRLEKASKILGAYSVRMGGLDVAYGVYKSCEPRTKAEIKGDCKLSPKLVIEEHKLNDCIWDASIAALPGAFKIGSGLLARTLADKSSELSQFVAKMTAKKRGGTDYEFAGALSNRDRIDAARGVLGRNLTQTQETALIEAHEMFPLNSLGNYSKEQIAAKKEYLMKNGFSKREADLLSVSGITGGVPKAISDIIRKIGIYTFKKDLSPAQVQAVLDAKSNGKLATEERLAQLKNVGFNQKEAEMIISGDFEKLATTTAVKNVSLPEPAITLTTVASAPKKSTAQELAEGFERQNSEHIASAMKQSRQETLASVKSNKDSYLKAGPNGGPDKIHTATTSGLNTDEAVNLMKDYATSNKLGSDGLLKLAQSTNQAAMMEAKKGTSLGFFNEYKLKELELKLMEEHYTLKYKNKFNDIDLDRFYDNDEAGFEAFSTLKEQIEKLRAKAANQKNWPKN